MAVCPGRVRRRGDAAGGLLGGLCEALGVRAPRLSVPSRLVHAVAGAAEAAWTWSPLPGRPPLTRVEVEFLALPRRYVIRRVRRELGCAPGVSYREGVAAVAVDRAFREALAR